MSTNTTTHEVAERSIREKLIALKRLQETLTSIDKIKLLRGELPQAIEDLSLIHISEPTRPLYISYAVFCLKKKKKKKNKKKKKKNFFFFFFLMIRRPPRSTLSSSSAASDVYKRQG